MDNMLDLMGVNMKTIDEVKPVIDMAVAGASALREEISETKTQVLNKESTADINKNISIQDDINKEPVVSLGEHFEVSRETENEKADEDDFELG